MSDVIGSADDGATEMLTELLNESAAVLCGDPTNEPHFQRTLTEINTALGDEGRADLLSTISNGETILTACRLAQCFVAIGESDEKALLFAARIVPHHVLPQFVRTSAAGDKE